MNKDTIICPGCGWIGTEIELDNLGACPKCRYENGVGDRLLTIVEMHESDLDYADVRFDLFLAAYDRLRDAAEREACAVVAETTSPAVISLDGWDANAEIAAAIRARGTDDPKSHNTQCQT